MKCIPRAKRNDLFLPLCRAGLILSGNEISQILSLILTYYGGSSHRPRWIAVGVGLSALSCLVLALPHFIYGPGMDALALTKEYLDQTLLNVTSAPKDLTICPRTDNPEHCDAEAMLSVSLLPRLLVFISQFILGIGTTLYYGLGQTYLDDNTKKKNTPMLLGEVTLDRSGHLSLHRRDWHDSVLFSK